MCGVLLWACTQSATNEGKFRQSIEVLRQANALRGPDSQQSIRCSLGDTVSESSFIDKSILLEFYASELRLRGSHPVVQPHQMNGNVLCWNGEIFDGLEVLSEENDGAKLFDALQRCQSEEDIQTVFGNIEGPYAFVYFQRAAQRLYFSRDPLGRRSLLVHKPTVDCPYFILTSVTSAEIYNMEELDTSCIFYVDFEPLRNNPEFLLDERALTRVSRSRSDFTDLARVNKTVPPKDWPQIETLDILLPELSAPVDDLLEHLDLSVMRRVKDIPQSSGSNGQARVAVLFSGGIDSAMIAALAHRHVAIGEPIDLLNVAFENPRKIRLQAGASANMTDKKRDKETVGGSSNILYMVPDRVTGLQEVEVYRRLYPERTWNFVEINVPYEESQAARKHVESLLLPSKTVMDMSLGLALYFAARGRGQVNGNPYETSARVLLNGLGSDELLGGYSRHKNAFISGSWEGLIEELQLDIDRIPTRNLGRDDRVISSHGKEARHPFLSLGVVNFLARLPVHYKIDPRANLGVGDKMLLRLAARKLGLIEASGRKKRAMQFGTHSARMEGEKRGDIILE